MVHITEFAEALGRSVQSTRRLIEQGNNVRKLKAFRDRSRLLIPIKEITGYPFTTTGPGNVKRGIFHYVLKDGKYEMCFCNDCTFSHGCQLRKEADELECPKGDD